MRQTCKSKQCDLIKEGTMKRVFISTNLFANDVDIETRDINQMPTFLVHTCFCSNLEWEKVKNENNQFYISWIKYVAGLNLNISPN